MLVGSVTLNIEEKLIPRSAQYLRGYIAKIFADDPVWHGHNPGGGFIYRYPLKIICLGIARFGTFMNLLHPG